MNVKMNADSIPTTKLNTCSKSSARVSKNVTELSLSLALTGQSGISEWYINFWTSNELMYRIQPKSGTLTHEETKFVKVVATLGCCYGWPAAVVTWWSFWTFGNNSSVPSSPISKELTSRWLLKMQQLEGAWRKAWIFFIALYVFFLIYKYAHVFISHLCLWIQVFYPPTFLHSNPVR